MSCPNPSNLANFMLELFQLTSPSQGVPQKCTHVVEIIRQGSMFWDTLYTIIYRENLDQVRIIMQMHPLESDISIFVEIYLVVC